MEAQASGRSVADVLCAHRAEERQAALTQALFPTRDAVAADAAWFGDKVRQLAREHSFALDGIAGKRVDVVGNVVNLAPVYWVSEFIVRILPFLFVGYMNF